VVLALALAAAIVQTGQPLHLHHGNTGGLYNEAHVLAALESVSGDAPLPAATPHLRLDVAPTPARSPVGAVVCAGVLRQSDSRAPPLI